MNEFERRLGILSPRQFKNKILKKRISTLHEDNLFGAFDSRAMALSYNGRILAVANQPGEIYFYNNDDWQYLNKLRFQDSKGFNREHKCRNQIMSPPNIRMLQFLPTGERLLFSSSFNGLQIHTLHGHMETLVNDPVQGHDLSKLNNYVAVVNSLIHCQMVRIVDIATGANLHRLVHQAQKVPSRIIAKWLPTDSSILLVANQDGFYLWDVRSSSQNPVRENRQAFSHQIVAMTFCHGGRMVLTRDSSGLIQRWPDQGLQNPYRMPMIFDQLTKNQRKYLKIVCAMQVAEEYLNPGVVFYHDAYNIAVQSLETGEILNKLEVFEPLSDMVYDEINETLYVASGQVHTFRPLRINSETDPYYEQPNQDWQTLIKEVEKNT